MFLLPPIQPRSPHPLCLPTTYHPNSSDNRNSNQQQPQNQQQSHHTSSQSSSLRTPLAALASDEALISYRKRALARYGANWLRPPGVLKTLQGQDDERAEREEAELQREQEARAQMELMRAQELEAEEMAEGEEEEGEGEGEGEGMVDLDAEVPDADAEGGEWSSDEEEDEGEEEEEAGEEEVITPQVIRAPARQIGAGIFDGPSTPVRDDDRTPQRFRLNPFQAPMGEGDGDYGSPLAARHAQRMATARVEDVRSPVVTSERVRGGQGSDAAVGTIDMDEDLDDAIPMDETMIEDGSYDHTDTDPDDIGSEDEGLPGSSVGVGSRSVFRTGAIGAAVRRISGQERRASAGQRRVSGDRRVSGRSRAHG